MPTIFTDLPGPQFSRLFVFSGSLRLFSVRSFSCFAFVFRPFVFRLFVFGPFASGSFSVHLFVFVFRPFVLLVLLFSFVVSLFVLCVSYVCLSLRFLSCLSAFLSFRLSAVFVLSAASFIAAQDSDAQNTSFSTACGA